VNKQRFPAPHPGDEPIISAALRSPSAHNAQPWRLAALADGHSYELRYAFADKLAADPDDRDALLALGAFYETLSLAAEMSNKRAGFQPSFRTVGDGMLIGTISLDAQPVGAKPSPLASALDGRMTNRHPYRPVPLPKALHSELVALGCTLLDPREVAPLVSKASLMAWKDRRFVSDLKQWTRFRDDADDGLTPACLNLSTLDQRALRFALWRGRLESPIAWVYAQRDVRLTLASSAVAVLSAPNREPQTLFESGRSLLRAWLTITSSSHSYHPISIVIDQATAPELTELANVAEAVAIFRVGFTPEPAVASNRRVFDGVMVAPSTEPL